ncbi:MAG: plasmid mobilization relaxosome protein MobC [Clostridia bacterium]|nr:plasmid mobilization relaxosome protein MobC [Clostridia bacterium]
MRNRNINIRLTEKELCMIEQKSIKANMTKTQFLINACNSKPIVIIEGLTDVAKQIHFLNNNLNQLVILAHQGKINNIELNPIREELNKIWQFAYSLSERTPQHTA